MTGSTPTSTVRSAALAPQQESAILAALAQIRVTNQADLHRAEEKLASLTAEGLLTEASMREVVAGAEYMVDDAAGILALVDDAERRLEAGEYGLCSGCGADIPFERLLLRPYRSTCIACS
mgnify:CR=1 FL=1|jgi:RNA polymerase-binding transcription factor DksA